MECRQVKLDIPDHLVNELLNVLGDAPAKRSYNLLLVIGPQADEHNKRVQAAIAQAMQPPVPAVEKTPQPKVEPAVEAG
jgi:hypothetical protein